MCGLCVCCGYVNVWALCVLWICECVGSVCVVDVSMSGCCVCVLWMCECVGSLCVVDVSMSGQCVFCGCVNVWALCVLRMCCVGSVCVVNV